MLSKIVICVIKAYQYIFSPMRGGCCRFTPTCSDYAIQALTIHGIWYGCGLTCCRLLKCHPWHEGGIDFVPDKKITETFQTQTKEIL